MDMLAKFLESPFTALFIAIVLSAVALSGKFSVPATQVLLGAAWLVAIFALRVHPLPVLVGGGALIGGGLLLVAYFFRPDVVPVYAGTLKPDPPQSTLLFSADGSGAIPKLQIGDSSVFLVGKDNQIGALLFPALSESQFKVEAIEGAMKVSARVTDESGTLIAELIQNDWKVAPPPGSWDRNYTDDTLEVKDAQGEIVLQVRVFVDRIQIQGAWWVNMGPPNGWVRMFIWRDPSKSGAQIVFSPKNAKSPPPSIPAIFEYPGDPNLGKLKAKR